jgi:hypothetical protein
MAPSTAQRKGVGSGLIPIGLTLPTGGMQKRVAQWSAGGLNHPSYGRFILRITKIAPETGNENPSACFSY